MMQSIGEGAYGKVNLAKDKTSGKLVAIKAVDITRICELGKDKHVLREKELLDTLRNKKESTHIINLLSTFKVRILNRQFTNNLSLII